MRGEVGSKKKNDFGGEIKDLGRSRRDQASAEEGEPGLPWAVLP